MIASTFYVRSLQVMLTCFEVKDVELICPTLITVSPVDYEPVIEVHHTTADFLRRSIGRGISGRAQFLARERRRIDLVKCVEEDITSRAPKEIGTLAISSDSHATQTLRQGALQIPGLFPRLGRKIKTVDGLGRNVTASASPNVELLSYANGSVAVPGPRRSPTRCHASSSVGL